MKTSSIAKKLIYKLKKNPLLFDVQDAISLTDEIFSGNLPKNIIQSVLD